MGERAGLRGRDAETEGLSLQTHFSHIVTHTPLFPVDKADGMDTKFSFITSSSKSSIGYSFRCSKETKIQKSRADRVEANK